MKEKDIQEKIVNAFIRIFNVKGHKTTLDEVAASIHISKKTIYKYFKNKAAIYDYVLVTAGDEIAKRQSQIFNDKDLSTKEKLYRILTITTSREKQIDISLVSDLGEAEPEFANRLKIAYEKRWQYFILLVNQGRRDGTLKPDTKADFLVHLLSSGMEMLYEKDFLRRNKITYTDGIMLLADTILSGVMIQ